MIRLSKSVLAVGAVVLAGSLITLMNPKTVHALAAALVQVTNTASNPAVTQSVGAQAGNMVHLTCEVVFSAGGNTCLRVAADGSASSFTVPAGESLVITAIDVLPEDFNVCHENYTLFLGTPNFGGVFLHVTTTNATLTSHFIYPSGLVIGEGITPTLGGDGSCSDSESVNMYGYLTAA